MQLISEVLQFKVYRLSGEERTGKQEDSLFLCYFSSQYLLSS